MNFITLFRAATRIKRYSWRRVRHQQHEIFPLFYNDTISRAVFFFAKNCDTFLICRQGLHIFGKMRTCVDIWFSSYAPNEGKNVTNYICDLLLHKRTSTYWKRIQLRKKKHTLRREKECEKVAEQKTIYTLMDRFGYRLWAEGSVQRVCSMYVCAKKERKEKKKTDFTSRFVILLRSDGRRERAMHAMRQWQDERKIPANMTLRNSWLLKIIEYTIAKTSNSVLVLIGAFKFSYGIEFLWEPRDELVQLDSRTYDWLIVGLFWICFEFVLLNYSYWIY